MLRIVSLNLNGIRSASSKGFLDWLPCQQPDIVCLQELKAQSADLTASMREPAGYASCFHYAEKKGYSGVGIYSRRPAQRIVEGLGVAEFDAEGRYLQADFETTDGALSLVALYLPSGSTSEERQQAKFRFMEQFWPALQQLADDARRDRREVVLCGDWNIAHREIDLKNWKSNQKNSGFLPEERAWLTRVFDELGWVDVYRQLHPDTTGDAYTWWSNRGQAWAKNVGWRIDYQIATPGIAAKARSASVFKDKRFSDHAPLIIDYEWTW
jgi:exodeoxyribonuclease-3